MKNNTTLTMFGDHGHNPKLIAEFNKLAKHFDVTELPSLLESWMDDTDLKDFTEMLKNRLYENSNEYVIEYNVRSLCGTKAYSAVILTKEEFGKEMFDDMISHAKHELTKDYSLYYLEQDIEGWRADGGNQGVTYDRAWVRSLQKPKEFLRYLESVL